MGSVSGTCTVHYNQAGDASYNAAPEVTSYATTAIGPTITVTAPNGGQTWKIGSSNIISWTYTGAPGTTVTIELLKGGVLNSTIAAGVSIGSSGSGYYNWTIPAGQAVGTDYKIQVTSNLLYTDTSNTNFKILP